MKKNIYVGKNEIFYNSQCMFVEYQDIIKMPMFILLMAIRNNENISHVFDTREIESLDTAELFEWYVNRKNINFFKDIPLIITDKKIPENFYDTLLEDYLSITDEFYTNNSELSFSHVIHKIVNQKDLVKRIIIYNNTKNVHIENDVHRMYGDDVEFLFGDFRELISQIPNDSTFVFSDINKINIMAEMNKLNYSSILIPTGYRYNMIDNNNYKVNFDELSKEFVFKYNFFNIINH